MSGSPPNQRSVKKWLAAAGISRKVSIHSLRHALATHLLEDGVNIFTIKELLGHLSISPTTIYLHLVDIGVNLIALLTVLETMGIEVQDIFAVHFTSYNETRRLNSVQWKVDQSVIVRNARQLQKRQSLLNG